MRENSSSPTAYPHIMIFDSGVGGLSVAREVRLAYPECRLTYASDNRFFPYGEKSTTELLSRVEQVIEALLTTQVPDVVVIACNTASTVTLPLLRQRFATPFVGVVPAIKPAAAFSQSKTLGVLGTPATVERPYTFQLIRDYARGCRVLLQGSGELVRQAENKLMGRFVDMDAIAGELQRLLEQPDGEKVDTIVLACTHFPLLHHELKEVAQPRNLRWVDSGEAIARRVGYWLDQLPLKRTHYTGPHQIVLTSPIGEWHSLTQQLPAYLRTKEPVALKVLDV